MTSTVTRCALVAAGVVALAAMPLTAQATPSSGVTGTIIAKTTIGGKDYILREITIAPGGSTGWHFHDGTLFGVVERGTLTHNESNCAVDGVFHAGDTIVEPSGANHVHIGRNLGTTPLVLEILYVDPAGSPLSEDAPNPGCGFQ
ncbi:MAG TPA: cupin domain-containing protein [Pseudonocardiaceae bacterium]|jgi:quercetin dioxygenase-like cupin family protein